MRFFILSIFFTISLFSKNLIIGVIPYKSKEELVKVYSPLLEYINKNSEYKLELIVSRDYKHLISLIKKNQIDIASLGSYLYIKNLNELENTNYLATSLRLINDKITWYYNSFIITKMQNNEINSIKDLKGKRFGFTDKNSTSGFLYPNFMLKEEGIDYKKDFSKYFFLKKHNRVIEALLNNSIDAAGTFDQVVYDTQKLYANQIKILAVSYPIPLDVFISSSKLNFQDTNNIKKLLLEYKAKPEINQILGFTKVKENVFEDIKSIIKSNNY
ncbi:hypothetical protein CP985_01100 [Malaciobacter mytili LMG 24559]|uniref:Phosphate/phosphite/phosphonate ABC transporter substrate-binding protein n=1 Tax=Malaciobacter mytili LMG 24559 TaxID=1032238 RepID=A0AAX2AKX0_9BACT|nr:phosphate/phosphite/phosphonate ABC transporter substrate-binding protein [Malaciobacter mytili]AXH14847.1 phosphonate ABC transporter, periplasmic substrate-binding protein [Malaciobacter mytili LMG 24559]RXK16783.1 hypothetical protein CP985_01100 [Malaciobacter mytili LMG 24559]